MAGQNRLLGLNKQMNLTEKDKKEPAGAGS